MLGRHEERIRERPYKIWERRGRKGNPEEHWLEAERELANEPKRLREHIEGILNNFSEKTNK